MTNTQIAVSFAKGATAGKSGNMFIDGQTIYSYGYHFPIATRLSNGWYLINKDRYSNTTARHIIHVYRALSGSDVIEAVQVGGKLTIDYLYLNQEYSNCLAKKAMARTEWSITSWNLQAKRYAHFML